MAYDLTGNWVADEPTPTFSNVSNTSYTTPTLGSGQQAATTNSGAGAALAGAAGSLLNNYYTQGGIADQNSAIQTGINNAAGAVQGMYNQSTALTTPYIQAGAGVGNNIQGAVNPYIGAGQNAIGNLQNLQGQALNVNSFLDPSMQFSMSEGQKALERSAAARGGVLSGAAMQDLMRYSQGLASQNYNSAANLALNDRNARANIGQSLYQGGLQGVQQLQPIYQGGVSNVGYQVGNASQTGQNLASLYGQSGVANGAAAAQGAAVSGSNANVAGQVAGAVLEEYGDDILNWIFGG